jgi:cytochrome c-type biogenesis protein
MGCAVTHKGLMEIAIAYFAGLLTLINPCVLPVLLIVLATALQAKKWGPLALAAGMNVMFIMLGIGIPAFGPALRINDQVGARVLFGVHHRIEVWVVQNLPCWLQDLTVRF